jgi:hypothetical protein
MIDFVVINEYFVVLLYRCNKTRANAIDGKTRQTTDRQKERRRLIELKSQLILRWVSLMSIEERVEEDTKFVRSAARQLATIYYCYRVQKEGTLLTCLFRLLPKQASRSNYFLFEKEIEGEAYVERRRW